MPLSRREPRWVDRVAVDAVHLDLVRTHGGLRGMWDERALESALARPRQLWAYGSDPHLAALAAAYGADLARSHPFHDGNKRVAFVVMAVFLGLNGYEIEAPEEEVVVVMIRLAAGDLAETDLAAWIHGHLTPNDHGFDKPRDAAD